VQRPIAEARREQRLADKFLSESAAPRLSRVLIRRLNFRARVIVLVARGCPRASSEQPIPSAPPPSSRTARELLARLKTTQSGDPADYRDAVLRTLQRRLKAWRAEMAHALVFGWTEGSAGNKPASQ
jgi:hypothetical protein